MNELEPATLNELAKAAAYLATAIAAAIWALLERRGRLNEARRLPRRETPSLVASLRPPPAPPAPPTEGGNWPDRENSTDVPTRRERKPQ